MARRLAIGLITVGFRMEVTSADIARLTKVNPSAVTNWRRRHPDFPAPVGGTDKSPNFDWTAVKAWLRRQGKAVDIPERELLWQALETLRGSWSTGDALSAVGLLLLHIQASNTGSAPAEPAELMRALVHAEHRVVFGNERIAGGLTRLLPEIGELEPAQLELLRATVKAAIEDDPKEIFEFLASQYLSGTPHLGFTTTSAELAAYLIEVAGPGEGILLDPACGGGEILLAASGRGYRRLFGQELSPAMARLAALRLTFASTDPTDPPFDLYDGDSLRRDAYPLNQAQAVICNPPFAERNWGHEELALDGRWEYGLPPRQESELAWVQHCLAHVARSGVVVIAMPPAAANRPSGRRIREQLVERGALHTVIALPPGLAAHYALPIQIWVLRQPSAQIAQERLLFIDLSQKHEGDEAAAWLSIGAETKKAMSAFKANPRATGRIAIESAIAVTRDEVLARGADLIPRVYLPLPVASGMPVEDLLKAHAKIMDQIRTLAARIPAVPERPDLSLAEVRHVTLDELAGKGLVYIRRSQPGNTGKKDHSVDIRAEDLIKGRRLANQPSMNADPLLAVRAGDVLIPGVAKRIVARVADEGYIGFNASPSIYVIRADQDVLDPWFLAGYLTSSNGSHQAARVASSMNGHFRFDPRRVRIPLPPIDVQRDLGRALYAVGVFDSALLDLFRDGRTFALDLIDGLLARLPDEGSRSTVSLIVRASAADRF